MEADSEKSRRVYGRGFFDGLKKAGIEDPKEFMNQAKQNDVEAGLSGIAKKILEHVPIGNPITPGKLSNEMSRVTGSKVDIKVITSCLNTMKERGLIREVQSMNFVRVPPKPRLVSEKKELPSKEEAMQAKPQESKAFPPPVAAIDRLAVISSKVRDLSKTITALASEIDDVAIEVEQQMQAIKADTLKLSQFKEFLKSI